MSLSVVSTEPGRTLGINQSVKWMKTTGDSKIPQTSDWDIIRCIKSDSLKCLLMSLSFKGNRPSLACCLYFRSHSVKIKTGQCPNSSFSQCASLRGLWPKKCANLCLILQICSKNDQYWTPPGQKPYLVQAVCSENKSLAKQCSWWEVSSLFHWAVLSLQSSGPISQARYLVRQGKDYWSFDVCCSVKCQRQSLCTEWHLPSKVLLMCPSVSQPSINHCIRQRHISLRTRSETRNASKPFQVFCPSAWRQKHTSPVLFALSHIMKVGQSIH